MQVPTPVTELLREAVRTFGVRSDEDQLLIEYKKQPLALMDALINPILTATTGITKERLQRFLGK